MQLRDFVKDGELRHSNMLDENREDCVKNDATTDVTFGRRLPLKSQGRRFLGPQGLRVCRQ